MASYQIYIKARARQVVTVEAGSFENPCTAAGCQSNLYVNVSNDFDIG